MLTHKTLEHRFVKRVPDVLEPGVLYVSVEFGTVVHTCCCGCGTEVVTPLTPTDWQITFDGESVSLWPSVGSWQIKCRSHYIIDRGRVIGSSSWTSSQVTAEKRRDRAAKATFYGEPQPAANAVVPTTPPELAANQSERPWGLWERLKHWWMG